MDADALLHPRGPLPPGVYWRRRLLTLLALLVVVVLVARSCGSDPHRLSPAPSPAASHPPSHAPSRSPSPSPSPSRSASPAAIGLCPDSAVEVTASADAQHYPAGARPTFAVAIRNVGTVACKREVGQAARSVLVTSGNDRIWSSDDCAPGGASQVVTLPPRGAPVTFTVTWSRKRSRQGCPARDETAAPGTYRVVGVFGAARSAPDTFTLG